MLPLVTCLCLTYARTALLEEAIESFLRQDYAGEAELVVLNDFAPQVLAFDHPRVRVINTTRFPSLGEKRNAAAQLARGELLLTWGDDDIHLPHRISRMVAALGEGPMCLEGWHFCAHGKMVLNRFPTTGAMICTREAWFAVGGVPAQDVGEDHGFNLRVKAHFGLQALPFATENPAFLYRWSGSDRWHISGLGVDKPGKRKAYDVMATYAAGLIADGREPAGAITLRPQWRADYLAACAAAIPVER